MREGRVATEALAQPKTAAKIAMKKERKTRLDKKGHRRRERILALQEGFWSNYKDNSRRLSM